MAKRLRMTCMCVHRPHFFSVVNFPRTNHFSGAKFICSALLLPESVRHVENNKIFRIFFHNHIICYFIRPVIILKVFFNISSPLV